MSLNLEDNKALLVRTLSAGNYHLSVFDLGGNLLCTIEDCCRSTTVMELKYRVEAEAGLDAALMILLHAEHGPMQNSLTLEASGIPNSTELYARNLHRVIVDEHLGIQAHEVTDGVLADLCGELVDNPPEILELCRCRNVSNIACLAQLSAVTTLSVAGCAAIAACQIKECVLAMEGLQNLDASSCGLCGTGVTFVADAIKNSKGLVKVLLKKNKVCGAEAGQALGNALAANTMLEVLDLSDQGDRNGGHLDTPFVQAFSTSLKNNDGALSLLNLSSNDLFVEGAKELASVLRSNTVLRHLDISNTFLTYDGKGGDPSGNLSGVIALAEAIKENKALTYLNLSQNKVGKLVIDEDDGCRLLSLRPVGAIAIADAVKSNDVLSTLVLQNNELRGAEAGKVLGDALAANTSLKELDLSAQGGEHESRLDVPFARALAVGLRRNRHLYKFTFGGDNGMNGSIGERRGKQGVLTPSTMEVSMLEADFSNRRLGLRGAILVAAFLPKCE
jgi:hypothetical protein